MRKLSCFLSDSHSTFTQSAYIQAVKRMTTFPGRLLPLVLGGLLVVGLACETPDASEQRDVEPQTFDWHIRGGTVLDGTGAEAKRADVLINEDTIAHVGAVDSDTIDARNEFDASGLHVTPGFIDPHAHGDPIETPEFHNFLAMGVTTVFLGQDGGSPNAEEFSDHLNAVEDAQPFVNVGYLTGHNTLRAESGIGHGTPSESGQAGLVKLVKQALDAGAFGLSLGLEYTPGIQAGMTELAAIAEPVAERNAIVMSHMRSEDAEDIEASVAELIKQGRRSGAHVHAAHLKIVLSDDVGQADTVLAQMENARREGVDVTADVYPYTASFTGLSIVFPEWARPPNDYEEVLEERRAELREHLVDRINQRNGPDAMLFGTGPWTGQTLAEVAESEGRPFADVLMELGPAGASAAYFVMDEAVMKRFLADDHTVVSSDGSPTMHHPRGYGSFARVLDRYTGEGQLLDLEEAVHKMTGKTASVTGLDNPDKVSVPRGYIREGYAADLLAFDPDEVEDRATFENPHQYARGMQRVWVNGTPTWQEDTLSVSDGDGRVLRAH